MKQGANGRRARGRSGGGGGRKQTPLKMQSFDSSGPDVRVRGHANQVYEKYMSLGRDANAAGDRVIAESYFQHAEHYYRIMNESTDPETEPARREHAGEPDGGGDKARGTRQERREQHERAERAQRDGGADGYAASDDEPEADVDGDGHDGDLDGDDAGGRGPGGSKTGQGRGRRGNGPKTGTRGRTRKAAHGEQPDVAADDSGTAPDGGSPDGDDSDTAANA